MADGEWIESYVPARLDRMPWSRWHWLIVVSLGATWILDGLEVTLAGSLGGILTRREALGLSDAQVGERDLLSRGRGDRRATFWVRNRSTRTKEIVFHYGGGLSHRHAVNRIFLEFCQLRFLSRADGSGDRRRICGNQFSDRRIDPGACARARGFNDQRIVLGRCRARLAATIVLLDPRRLPIWLGWRCAFGIGAMLGLVVIFFRQWIPESPRWLMIHGRNVEAEQIVA
jgi:hypothetical protein